MPAAPISLYIDLEPGQTAELENVARASLAFAAGIREIAYLIDPSFEFRIEIERGDKSSLWLKAFIRWVRGLGHAHPTMVSVIAAAGTWFALETGAYTYEKFLDHLYNSKDPEIVSLEPDQLRELARRVADVASSPSAGGHFREVYLELGKDPAVRGVGVSSRHDVPPAEIVPVAEFARRAAGLPIASYEGEVRTNTKRGDFVIIRPVLKEGSGRWRLRGPEGEFSAVIADDQFINDVLLGRTNVPLAAEIHMNADLELREQRVEEGAWKPLSYRITKVHSIDRRPDQPPLFSPPDQ